MQFIVLEFVHLKNASFGSMHCRTRTCYSWIYLGLLLLALVLVHQTVVTRSQQQYYLNKKSGKEDTGGGKDGVQLQADSDMFNLKKSRSTSRRVLFKGRAYTTPHIPYAVLPDFQRLAMSPTKPPIPFHFPHPNLTKAPEEIFSTVWVAKLHKILKSMPSQASKEVTVVFSDSGYTESLLNWLIAAQARLKPPMKNVLVVCLDKDVFHLLSQNEISSILVERKAIMKPSLKPEEYSYSHMGVIKMVVLRLVNYFGYNVILYNTDAIPLRNLQPVFEKYMDHDIVGSVGGFPISLGRAWGFTMSTEVIRFKSSGNTGKDMVIRL